MRTHLVVAAMFAVFSGVWVGWSFPTLQGEEIPLERFYEGKWCLDFVVAPECLACAVSIGWLKNWQAEQTQSHIQTVLVVPWDTPELRASLEGVPFPVVIDSHFVLASWFKVKVAPTVVLFAEGTFEEKLEWPFKEDELRAKLFALEDFVIPRPHDLVGSPPPELRGTNLDGASLGLEDLPKPLLIFFFSTTCPACRASLELMEQFTELLPVALVVLSKGKDLSEEDKGELRGLKAKYGDKVYIILLGAQEKETMERFRIRWTPTFFLVDAGGTLMAVWEGESGTMILEIEEILGSEGPGGG